MTKSRIFATSVTLLALTLGACGGGGGATESSAPAEGPVPSAIYSVRGQVDSLPEPEGPGGWMAVQHEAIPELVGMDGELDPMDSMTMRFPVAEGVDLSSLNAGDKVLFDLQIDWMAGEPAQVLSVTALPAETELDLGDGDGDGEDHSGHDH